MNFWGMILILTYLSSCATQRISFNSSDASCSSEGTKYLLNPRYAKRKKIGHESLLDQFKVKRKEMQKCYEDLNVRTGLVVFKTCFVAGFNEKGERDIFHFSSNSVHVDEEFLRCGKEILRDINALGRVGNALIAHSYRFYLSEE